MDRLTLPSNASMEYYPQNTLSNFTVKPSQPFNGEGYECALTEIMYPNRLFNIREDCNTVIIRRMRKKKGDYYSHKGKLIIPPGYYNVEDLITAIDKSGLSKYVTRKNNEVLKSVLITFDKVEKKVTVEAKHQYAIQFGCDIATVLGFPLAYDAEFGDKYSKIIEGVQKGEFHATSSGGLNTLFVYTDIIQEQYVGGINAPLLRIINLDRRRNDEGNTSHTFDRLYFARLKSSHFDSVNIRIYDDMGKLVHFEYGKVIVNLEFRKSI